MYEYAYFCNPLKQLYGGFAMAACSVEFSNISIKRVKDNTYI